MIEIGEDLFPLWLESRRQTLAQSTYQREETYLEDVAGFILWSWRGLHLPEKWR